MSTVQELKSSTVVRIRSDELEALIQRSLKRLTSNAFTLSIYFGRNVTRSYDRLASQLFQLFPAPMLRAEFRRTAAGEWQLHQIQPISAEAVPEHHRSTLLEAAEGFFRQRRSVQKRRPRSDYDLAILHDPEELEPPSDEKALKRIMRAARRVGLEPTLIQKRDLPQIAQYDALFIRETTSVNHHTFRFARRAQAEGLYVVDDPESILRCTNKVFLAELMTRHKVPTPRSVILHAANVEQALTELELPCVLKQPDSAFSRGVHKVSTEAELKQVAAELLKRSELIIAQEYLPTTFDWRIGVFQGQPVWACKYHMAPRHWQIVKSSQSGQRRFGRVESLPVDEVPGKVLETALTASQLIGDGLYGVDLKQVGRRVVLIEVNDNPNLDAGYEDRALGDELYLNLMQGFRDRIERRRRAA